MLQILTKQELQKLTNILPKKLIFKDIKFPVNIRDIYEIEKKNFTNISVFGYLNKKKHPIYVLKKRCEDKHVDL